MTQPSKKITRFVSEIDQLLSRFDQQNPKKSISQQQEISKYRRVYYLRDVADRTEDKDLPQWF